MTVLIERLNKSKLKLKTLIKSIVR